MLPDWSRAITKREHHTVVPNDSLGLFCIFAVSNRGRIPWREDRGVRCDTLRPEHSHTSHEC